MCAFIATDVSEQNVSLGEKLTINFPLVKRFHYFWTKPPSCLYFTINNSVIKNMMNPAEPFYAMYCVILLSSPRVHLHLLSR